jgi:CheY-like chemotaxis protein
VLESQGYAFVEAGDAGEALQKLQRHEPDLMLVDVNLPDLSGYALTRRIRRMPGFFEIPIIALTAEDAATGNAESSEAGCDGFIAKPMDLEVLLGEIEQKLQRGWNPLGRVRLH